MIHIVKAADRAPHWAALLSLLRTSFAYMDARIDPPSSLQAMTEDDLRAKAQRETLILANNGAALVGCVYADLRQDVVYVGKLAVAAEARGQGVARALLQAADDLARRHGRAWLELQTRIELVENHRSFEALGFVKTAETSHPGYARVTSITMRRPVVGAAS